MPELLVILGLPSAVAVMATVFVVVMSTLGDTDSVTIPGVPRVLES